MKYNFIFASIVLFIPNVFCMSDEMKELAASLHNTCVGETGVDESLMPKVNAEKKMIDDPKLKCYIKCLMSQMGCIDDAGVIDVEAVIEFLPEEIKSAAAPAIRKCGSIAGSDACDSAWLTQKCWLETKPDVYILL